MKARLFCWLFFSLFTLVSQGQIITTFAGTTMSGHSGDGGPATSAKTHNPAGCAFDKHGNFYFAEYQMHCIRKVDINGIITTVAGNLTFGYNGDNIPATSANLFFPSAVITDTLGNLFISDGNNCRIRKVDMSTGLISTVAGNGTAGYNGDGIMATNAQLKYPGGICFDSKGNLYISDPNNRRLRVVNAITGIISTYAGNGNPGTAGDGGLATNAEITPGAICADKHDNIYIADYSTNQARVARVNYLTGIINTIAGTKIAYIYNGDGIPATAANIAPNGLVADKPGNLFIADGHNDRIRKITPSGYIYNIAGNGVGGYGGDEGPATAAQIDQPYGVALDTCGNLYFSDINNARVRKVALNPTCEPITSVNTLKANDANFTISPNPTSSTITLTSTEKINTLSIINAVGEVVSEQQCAGKEKVEVNVAHLPKGIYMARVNGVYVRRFLKE